MSPSALRDLHTRSLEIATDFVDAVGPDDLTRPADADGHDLGDLLATMCEHNHVAATALIDDADGGAAAFTPRRGDHGVQWRETAAALHSAAAAAPDAMDATIAAHLLDTVVHTRVLAVAMGLDWRPTPAATEAIVSVARTLPGGEQRLVTSGLVARRE